MKGTVIRTISIAVLICLCITSVLYVDGYFEFSFIDRHPDISVVGGTTSQPLSTTDQAISDSLSSLVTGDSISQITSSNPETTTGGSIGDTESGSTSDGGRFSPDSVSDYINAGYKITYDDYTNEMVIAEVVLPDKFGELYTGGMVTRVPTDVFRYSDETFRRTEMTASTKERYTVESYMGYILIASNNNTLVLDGTGKLLFTYEGTLAPAYTRDKSDRPLYFTKNVTEFYYIDFEANELKRAEDYVDQYDGRGLYFNYNPSFGKSDNQYTIFWKETEFTRHYEIDLASDWKKLNVSPLIAKELWKMYPLYCTLTAKVNMRFAAALDKAQYELWLEEESIRKEEESKKLESSLETTLSPEETSAPAEITTPVTTISPEETTNPSDITAPETTLSPEEPTSPSENVTSSAETVTAPMSSQSEAATNEEAAAPSEDTTSETVTPPEVTTPEATTPEVTTPEVTTPDTTAPESTAPDTTSSDTTAPDVTVAPDETTSSSPEETTKTPDVTIAPDSNADTTATPETTPTPETTSKYPSNNLWGYDWINKTFNEIRFAVGKTETSLIYGFSLQRAYNFSEGRAAVVDDNGRMFFINTRASTVINGYQRYFEEIAGQGSGLYYLTYFYEPLYQDHRGIGHLYFDNGYVMVRRTDIEAVRNKISGRDDNILLNTAGAIITPPDGYTLVTCTEGIMVLERNGRYGYYSIEDQTWIAQPIYTYIEPFYEGIGVIGIAGGNIGAIDHQGNVVIPFRFSHLSMMSTGLISGYSTEFGWQVFAKLKK